MPVTDDAPRAWQKWVQALFTLERGNAAILCGGLLVVVSVIDVLTPPYLNFSFVYAFIILLATWNVGVGAGLFFTLLSAAVQVVVMLAPAIGEHFTLSWYVQLANRWFTFFVVVALTYPLRILYNAQQATARVDALTGAANRKHFDEVLNAEIARGVRAKEPLTAVYLDCDDFKIINDRFGHIQGDAALRAVVATARGGARTSDTVARLGGDEFALLLPNTDSANAAPIVERLNARLLKAMEANHWPMTFSIGVATFMKDDVTPAEVMTRSDTLMYRAKRAGKGRTVFEYYGPEAPALDDVGYKFVPGVPDPAPG
jgi:diguanylate cyclase (GGDEF)-like protein